MSLKICVYAISKNEEQFVERFCDSAKDADLILIADTGSTDNTAALARQCGAVVPEICIKPWRFDLARNAAMALIPADIDVCISLDLDEVLEPGWREEIERVWVSGTTRLSYMFDWGVSPLKRSGKRAKQLIFGIILIGAMTSNSPITKSIAATDTTGFTPVMKICA